MVEISLNLYDEKRFKSCWSHVLQLMVSDTLGRLK
jgi:hypothetical protein